MLRLRNLFRESRAIGSAAAFLVIAGCATPDIATAPAIELAPANALPAPSELGADGQYVYQLGPLDSISIEVEGLPESLRNEVVVDGQGMIAYPLAGSVHAAGLTTTQLARTLEERLRESSVRNPRVIVNLVTPVSNAVTVSGQVNKPGIFPVYRDLTLSQAIALAGGENEFARTSVVLVFREVEAQQYVGVYDLKAIRYGNYSDPQLYPNDRVVVSEAEARRLLQTIGPFVSLVTTPLIYLINRNR